MDFPHRHKPCTCRFLHKFCKPESCPQKQHAHQEGHDFRLSHFRENASRGCITCSAIYKALCVEPVRNVWRSILKPDIDADKVEQSVFVQLMRTGDEGRRVVLRTRSSGDSRWWRHFNIYLDAEAADSTSCLALGKLRCVPLDQTDCEESYQCLRYWLDQCNNGHQCIVPQPPSLPKRVLKISNNRVYLHLSQEDEKARYATLSHRWGSSDEHFVLTLTNLESLTQDIPWTDIPKTAQDAIKICRTLDLEYLWIDSLCILQGYKPDWKDQSERMSAIYGKSYLNIAATDSNDSDGGCFRRTDHKRRYPAHVVPDHPTLRIQQQPHFTHFDFGANYQTSNSSPPLLRRGWVLQERLLSPRCVYYGKDEMLWECKACADCFCGGTNVIARFKDFHHNSLTASGEPLPFAWMRITERYSCLDLTRDSDRAIALSGIAQEAAASGRGGKYLAGMWSQNLAHQLVWQVTNTFRKPKGYIAPSWSWLSIFGKVEYGQNRMDYHAQWSRIDVVIADVAVVASRPDGTGKIESGHLVVNGKTLEMKVEILGTPKGRRPELRLTTSNPRPGHMNFAPDYVMDRNEALTIEKVVVLHWGEIVLEETFMVLRRVPHNDGVAYERLGLFQAGGPWIDHFRQACEPSMDLRIV